MFKETRFFKSISLALWLIVAFICAYILYIGQAIFIPLVISFFILVIFTGVYLFFKNRIHNKYISFLLSLGIFILFFIGVGFIVSSQVGEFIRNIGSFQTAYENLVHYITTISGGRIQFDIFELVQRIDFSSIGRGLVSGVSNMLGSLSSVFVILVFLALEKKYIKQKFKKMLDIEGVNKLKDIYDKIYNDLNVYFVSKFFIALGNGLVSIIIMSLFGLDFALVFGLLVFLLDFVPAVGGIIALGLPFLYSFVQFDSVMTSFLMLICLNIPQTITGNFIEPRVMGDRLNISGLVIIISLLFWGMFWGIIGAFLAVPIMTTINIILAKFKTTKPIAILMSKNGKV